MQKESNIFEVGDIISNIQKKDVRVITKIDEDNYYFIALKDPNYKDISGQDINYKKGDTSSQPKDIVEKYFCVIEISKLFITK